MGIDIHTLNFLKYAKTKKQFDETITIGRQGLHLSNRIINKVIGSKIYYEKNEYCENLLIQCFGATTVNSIDNSNYENATYIHDMNEPITAELNSKFDTVFDGGCLEHIFNIPQAFKNCSLFLKPGGQILHSLPANNCCGHGFYQFSPELFFSLYSEKNGYVDTEVFIADLSDTKNWFKVKAPQNGHRVNIESSNTLYILVRTVLKSDNFKHSSIQQSDYINKWSSDESNLELTNKNFNFREKLRKIKFIFLIISPIYQYILKIFNYKLYLDKRSLTLVNINRFINNKK
jgi:SAM-dependent methyltransferase